VPSKRADQFSDWKQELILAERYQAEKGRLDRWKMIRDYYLNRYPPGVVSVNLLFAIGRAMVPQLYFKAPNIIVRPRPTTNIPRLADRRAQARVLQAADEWLVQHMMLKSQLKLMILDSYRVNLGVAKIGYHSISSEVPQAAGPADMSQEQLDAQMTLMNQVYGPTGANALETQLNEENKTLQYNYHDLIHPDSPWFLRISPEDLLVPWGTRDTYSAPWCAFRVIRPLEDVKADPVYSSAVVSTFNANSTGGRVEVRGQSKPGVVIPLARLRGPTAAEPGAVEFLEFYEVWDKRSGRVFAVCLDQGSDFMRNDKHNLGLRGLPLVTLQFNPDGDDFWGASDAEQILTQVTEYNEARTQEMIHRRLANVKCAVDKNKVSVNERRRLASPNAGPVIECDGSPGDSIAFVQPPIGRELFQVSETIRDDIREVIGFSRNQVGEFEVSRRTATEASIVQQNLTLRGDERRDQCGDVIQETFQEKIHPMIFIHWTNPRAFEVTGETDWRELRGPEVAGDYDVNIVPDSTLPLSKLQAKQDATVLFQAGKGDMRVKQGPLYRWFYSQFEGVPIDELLRTDEEMQQLQQQLIQIQKQTQAGQMGQQLVASRKGGGGNGAGSAPV